ncbi:hypothetical protein DMB42_32095 [Nonomuraea sp. WAC 01424]|uniref:iron-containing redox enzyme family protein n=1 Tax=Nonomuraea sp. WAC 01424 TaxID=2203200 RepID=UPI000F7A6F54|nr:iron-containing redox enzyme family protein [Nonomuraea sp. WAC 01424]RSN04308.1 hypothetical protein DMB42_32095 [Nonomuraea sp. WAC 01424]
MRLPPARGPLTDLLFDRLTRPPATLPDAPEPSLLRLRGLLERRFERELAEAVPRPEPVPPAGMRRALTALTAEDDDGASVSLYLQREAGIETFREFVVHRSIYHLKEADPHTWAIPRLRGLGLDDSYGAYLPRVPAVTLAVTNAMSLFGLHRRLRGALVGHLAAIEMTSSLPNRRYAVGLRAPSWSDRRTTSTPPPGTPAGTPRAPCSTVPWAPTTRARSGSGGRSSCPWAATTATCCSRTWSSSVPCAPTADASCARPACTSAGCRATPGGSGRSGCGRPTTTSRSR